MRNRKPKNYMARVISAMILAIIMVAGLCAPASFAEGLPSDQLDQSEFMIDAVKEKIGDESIANLYEFMLNKGVPSDEVQPDTEMKEYWQTRGKETLDVVADRVEPAVFGEENALRKDGVDDGAKTDANADVAEKYGTLSVRFDIFNGTEASSKQQEVVKITFRGEGAEDVYAADIQDKDGQSIKTVEIKNGEEISVEQNQKIFIDKIKDGTEYEVTKLVPAGFESMVTENDKGVIVANCNAYTYFAESYISRGMVEFRTRVENKGQPLERYQYEYQLCDLYTGSVFKTAMNMEDGDINFGKIFFENWGEPKQTLLFMEPYYQLSGDIEDINGEQAFIVEVLPTDNGAGAMTFEVNYYDDATVWDTAEIINCDVCGGDGIINNTTCDSCKGRGVDHVVFHEQPIEDPYFGQKAPEPCNVTLTAKVENVEFPENIDSLSEFYLYDYADGALDYIGCATADANGDISFGTLTFDMEDIGKTYYFIICQSPMINGNNIIYDNSTFGYSVSASVGEDNKIVCDVNYIDTYDFVHECETCHGEMFEPCESKEVSLKYITDFANYAGFGFAEPYIVDVESADDVMGIMVADDYMEYIPAVRLKNGSIALDPAYEYVYFFGQHYDLEELPTVNVYVFSANNDEAHFTVEFPSMDDANNANLYTVDAFGDFIQTNATEVEVRQSCTACEGTGLIVNLDWKPGKAGREPVFRNYYVNAEMNVEVSSDDDAVPDEIAVVYVDGTDNCAEAPCLDVGRDDAAEELPENIVNALYDTADAMHDILEDAILFEAVD